MKEELAISSWDAIVCCSGDDLPHEVINGLALRNDGGHVLRNVPIVQLPGGSGNATCVNLFGTTNISLAALYVIKGVLRSIDLMSITQGDIDIYLSCHRISAYWPSVILIRRDCGSWVAKGLQSASCNVFSSHQCMNATWQLIVLLTDAQQMLGMV